MPARGRHAQLEPYDAERPLCHWVRTVTSTANLFGGGMACAGPATCGRGPSRHLQLLDVLRTCMASADHEDVDSLFIRGTALKLAQTAQGRHSNAAATARASGQSFRRYRSQVSGTTSKGGIRRTDEWIQTQFCRTPAKWLGLSREARA